MKEGETVGTICKYSISKLVIEFALDERQGWVGWTTSRPPDYHSAKTESHTYSLFIITNKPNMHIFGLWEEVGGPGQNL